MEAMDAVRDQGPVEAEAAGAAPLLAHEACIVAIDPGLTGAVAFYFPSTPDRVAVEDMPTVDGEVDVSALTRRIAQMGPTLGVVEKVEAMPSIPGKDGKRRAMGATSAFNFGMAFGAAKAAVAAAGVPLHLVKPTVWKKRLGVPGGAGGKEAGRAMAIRLFPACAVRFERKKDHGRADAALLARYAAETLR